MARKVTVQPSGNVFDVPDGDTILVAALNEGFHLPYGCRNGACGSCKGKLVAGEIDYGKYQHTALSEDERAAGYALFCVAKPLSDVTIESREIGAVKDIVVKKLPCRVHKLERVTDDVMILQLKLPANERLQFLAGQYIEFILKDGARRSFSMANAPHDDEFLQLHVRYVSGGSFTDHVFNKMKERDILRFEGPLGSFFLHESEKPIVFVASGTGFAPIKAIIESAFKHDVERAMTLYWGGRRPRDLYLDALARQWAAERPQQFKYVAVISDGLPEDAWTGRSGFVHHVVMADFPDLSGVQVYACGVPIMVESARRDFTHHRGLPIDEFFADSFTTQADLAAG
ncbi:MAG: CDP-6-deoxy-delta-3,4-glucoseen reductase [Burkholderiales bacterium]